MGLLDSFTGSSGNAPPYRPAFKIGQGAAGGGGGLMGAASGAVSSVLGSTARDPWADALQSLCTDQQLAPGVDGCTIEVASAGLPDVALGDQLKIDLGYADQLATVYSGQVSRLQARHDQTLRIDLDNGAQSLARLRVNSSFEQQNLSGIVNKLLSEAGISAGTVNSGADFPFLAVDDRQSVWAWLAELAQACGAWVWLDADGQVQVKPGGGPAAATFTYGQDILSLQFQAQVPVAAQLTVVGEGASGSQGSDAWSWLSKKRDPIQAQQGSGDARQTTQSALRNLSALQGSAQGWQARLAASGERISLSVAGTTAVSLAGTFAVSGCPQGRGDGDYLATRIRHRYDKQGGFVTWLDGQRAGGSP
jgi:hypothetical protein